MEATRRTSYLYLELLLPVCRQDRIERSRRLITFQPSLSSAGTIFRALRDKRVTPTLALQTQRKSIASNPNYDIIRPFSYIPTCLVQSSKTLATRQTIVFQTR